MNRGTGQILAKNTFWLGFGEITGRLLKLIIIFYAIRVLGAYNWGAFSYTISLCALFMIFADIGLSSVLTRELAKKENEESKYKYIATSFLIKLLLNIIILFLILFVAPSFSKNALSTSIIPIIGILMISDSIREFMFAINRSMEKMEIEAFVKILTSALLVIFSYIFLLKSESVVSLAMGYMLGSLCGLFVTLIIFRKYFKKLFLNFSKNLIQPLILIAWPFAFFAVLGSIISNTDTVMLGWMKGNEEVGFYATGQRVVAFMYIVPSLITSSLLPTLSKQIENKEKIEKVLYYVLRLIYLFAIPVVLGGLVVGNEMIIKLFGQEYAPSIGMFKVLLISILFTFPSLVFNTIIFIFNKHESIVKISFIGTLLNIGINLILIPIYGGLGAAMAATFSQAVIMIMMKNTLNKVVSFSLLRGLDKIIFTSLVMLVIVIILDELKINIWVNIGISLLSYLFILKAIKEDSLSKILKIKDSSI